jgi:hypothetical protein
MRAFCRQRTAYRWQSLATDMFHPLTDRRSEFFCRVRSRRMRLDNHLAPRFGLQKVGGLKPGFGGLQKFPALFD